jgi:hypothetical protein
MHAPQQKAGKPAGTTKNQFPASSSRKGKGKKLQQDLISGALL